MILDGLISNVYHVRQLWLYKQESAVKKWQWHPMISFTLDMAHGQLESLALYLDYTREIIAV